MCEIETFKNNFLFFYSHLSSGGENIFYYMPHISHKKKPNVCSVLSGRPNNLTERILYLFVYRVGVVNHPPFNFCNPDFYHQNFLRNNKPLLHFGFPRREYFYFFFVGHQYNRKIGFGGKSKCFSFFFFILFNVRENYNKNKCS